MLKQVIDEVEPAKGCGTEQVNVWLWLRVCVCLAGTWNAVFVPAVFENKQDVIPESVSVLFQDPTNLVEHLKQEWGKRIKRWTFLKLVCLIILRHILERNDISQQ